MRGKLACRKTFLFISFLVLIGFKDGFAQAWIPPHFSVSPKTISPNGRYGVMLPDSEVDAPDKIVDIKTGLPIADIAGASGSTGGAGGEMRWGEMEAFWSKDSSTLCWIHPDKWFPQSYVIVMLKGGKLAWQKELMWQADKEILTRTEAAAPLNFAIAKVETDGNGSAYPEGFDIEVSQPTDGFSLPLICHIELTSNIKNAEGKPGENEVRASLKMTVNPDGTLSYSGFKVERGPLSKDAAERVKAANLSMPLVDTDLGKAILFSGLGSKDGLFAIGWTVLPASKETPPVDWAHWDPMSPYKLLRLYDWDTYARLHDRPLPYRAIDFVLNRRTGKTVVLAGNEPTWPGKKDGWGLNAVWYNSTAGQRYALIQTGQSDFKSYHFLLANLIHPSMQITELTATLNRAVNDLLHERRPEIASDEFFITYPLLSGEKTDSTGIAEVPFAADPQSSNEKELRLKGVVDIRLLDGAVIGATSDEKKLDPFVNNAALKQADEALNKCYQKVILGMSPQDAETFKKEEIQWLAQRDADATQAVNILPDESTQQAAEDARENSLLESTEKRLKELKSR